MDHKHFLKFNRRFDMPNIHLYLFECKHCPLVKVISEVAFWSRSHD